MMEFHVSPILIPTCPPIIVCACARAHVYLGMSYDLWYFIRAHACVCVYVCIYV